jgi:hypothetical protein
MHGSIVMTKGREEEKSKNNSDEYNINRGFELMLRNTNTKKVSQHSPWFELKFEKLLPFFRKQINFYIHFSLDIRKITQVK